MSAEYMDHADTSERLAASVAVRDALYAGLVDALRATEVYDVADPEGYDVTPARVVAAVIALRERAERAEAERDALRASAREYLRVGSMASYRALASRVGLTVREG